MNGISVQNRVRKEAICVSFELYNQNLRKQALSLIKDILLETKEKSFSILLDNVLCGIRVNNYYDNYVYSRLLKRCYIDEDNENRLMFAVINETDPSEEEIYDMTIEENIYSFDIEAIISLLNLLTN